MATYSEIQNYVENMFGYEPKTCWIAHAKEIFDILIKRAHNRFGERLHPCPTCKLGHIGAAFDYFRMII